MTINQRISLLRKLMKSHGLNAYIIGSSDPHQSEYVADRWKSREWISGFSGSAGTAIITMDHAGIWTDSRYFIQAEEELKDSEVELHKQKVPHAPEHLQWLSENLKPMETAGCDGMLFSIAQISALQKALAKNNIKLDHNVDLIQEANTDRPELPDNPIFDHPVKYAGTSRVEKIKKVISQMPSSADFHLITTLDDIAWTLNLRSSDVESNPVFISYLIVGRQMSYLFVDDQKLPTKLKEILKADGITIKPYDAIPSFLSDLPKGKNILIDQNKTSMSLYKAISEKQIVFGPTIPIKLKAIKSEAEVNHIRQAMVKDGVALTKLYRWLDKTLEERSVPEAEVAKQLAEFRSQNEGYFGESFGAIVGYKGNGAIVHYSPKEGNCAQIKKEGILLLDSGGQYVDGTTDITRTTFWGTPTETQKRDYTLVLKGCIALTNIVFPEGTKGIQLDTLARQFLWNEGLNYGHGTGHGVGYFLNVHEGPQSISASVGRGKVAMEAGMITSNEPGFYKPGAYGIRIENLILTEVAMKNEFGRFLKSSTLTLFPIATNLIAEDLLTEGEKEWLNNYHQEVFDQLSPKLNEEEKEWLKEKCRAI
ncbi:MAG: aminopeptidase P family protein [Saprospiraceae bacterium]